MADKAHEWTDKEIDRLERRLKKVYKEAESDLKDKLSKALETIDKAPSIYEEYKELKKVGKLDEAERKLKEYQKVMKSATNKKEFYENHLKTISNDITHLNERALAYANDKVPDVLKHNYNFVGGEASKHIQGYNFHMADEHTVKQMSKKLPKKKVKITKDHSYNNKLINSQLLQGIIQGEDIPTIAQRMSNVMNTEWKASVRNARTMMTSAENLGRMESYEQMQEDGLVLKKVWLATPDERTRQSHLELDGVELDIDEPFETINGNQLMYPADPDGEPEEVYNCRCTLITHVIGFRTKDGVKTIDYERPMSEHDKAIEAERESREDINNEPDVIVREPEEKTKNVTVDDLTQDQRDMLYDYTDGYYDAICEYTQYLETGDKKSPSQFFKNVDDWKKYKLAEIDEKTKENAEKILNVIKNNPISEEPLIRLESGALNANEGDVLTFGVRSTSRDMNLINGIAKGEVDGLEFDLLGKNNNGDWTEYRILKSRGLDVSKISAYPSQKETLIAGRYKVIKIETIEAVKGGLEEIKIKVKDKAENVEYFTSKKGNEMVRYNYNGKTMTDTVAKFESRIDTEYVRKEPTFGRKIITLEVER